MKLDKSYICPELKQCKPLMSLYKRYTKKAKNIYYGRNRIVFDMGRYVVKLPSAHGGFGDNDWEGSIGNGPEQLAEPLKYVQYARTRLMYVNDIPVCLMEKVEHATVEQTNAHLNTLGGESDWTWSVDGGQVGFNSRGKLVAYDYGMN